MSHISGPLTQVKYWYHGTTSAYMNTFDRVDASISRENRDFGKGFYLTSNREQAILWAKRKASMINESDPPNLVMPMIIVCTIKMKNIEKSYHFKSFGQDFSEELLNYLVFNRLDRGNTSAFPEYDAVFGLVADGTSLDKTLESYKNSDLDFKEAKSSIEYKSFQSQICLKNQKLLDSGRFKIKEKKLIKE